MFDKYYDLLTYRGLQPPAWMLQLTTFMNHFHDRLVKDSNEQKLDPFLHKVVVQPPKKGRR